MPLRRFIEDRAAPDRSLVVVNRTAPQPVQSMLTSLFERQPVSVEEAEIPDAETDQVLLVEEGDVVASSPLDELQDAILFINSDLFMTGTRGIEDVAVPDVLAQLDEVPFRLRGYPESHSEKLLLILISRYIERRAWRRQAGTIRSSFQYLDRIEDEVGTQQAYHRLDDTDVDVHLYGAPGWEPTPDSGITIHAGYDADLLESWFVVYTPPEGDDGHVALLAVEEGPNEWRGFWTYRASTVTDLTDYITREL